MPPITTLLARALAAVDPADETSWTHDDQVRVDVVNEHLAILGSPPITRQEIIDAAPTFTRLTAPAFRASLAAAEAAARAALEEASPLAPKAGNGPPSPSLTSEATAPTAAPRPALVAVLALPLAQLFASPELLSQAIVQIDVRCQELIASRRAIDSELVQLGQKAELCSRQLDRLNPRTDPSDGIRAYLARQAVTRESRRARALAFSAQGTTAKEVAATLLGPSQLDAAMSRRKPALGSGRPNRSPLDGNSNG